MANEFLELVLRGYTGPGRKTLSSERGIRRKEGEDLKLFFCPLVLFPSSPRYSQHCTLVNPHLATLHHQLLDCTRPPPIVEIKSSLPF